MKKKLLVISNGKGEDSIAITILNKLREVIAEEKFITENFKISTLPLVDNGSGYKKNGYDTLATWNTLPSKGFNILNIFNLIKDLNFGLGQTLKKQISLIKKEAADSDLIVTVGDILPLLLAGFWGHKKPIIHIGTAISAYIREYSLLETIFLKKFATCVICRDALTAEKLQEQDIAAIYYGNPMMDDPLLKKTNINLNVEENKKNIVLVPSSREDAYYNTSRMLKIIGLLGKRANLQFILSMAPNLNTKFLSATVSKKGWRYIDRSAEKKPLIAEIVNDNANTVYIIKGYFRDCLDKATVVFGMTGTGNEQIAGLGIPIVLLQGKNTAASSGRMVHYKKLLSKAVFIPTGNDKKKAQKIIDLLKNNKQLAEMSKTGKQRMGKPGGAYSIARKIFIELFETESNFN